MEQILSTEAYVKPTDGGVMQRFEFNDVAKGVHFVAVVITGAGAGGTVAPTQGLIVAACTFPALAAGRAGFAAAVVKGRNRRVLLDTAFIVLGVEAEVNSEIRVQPLCNML
jgi:hypothetical protein